MKKETKLRGRDIRKGREREMTEYLSKKREKIKLRKRLEKNEGRRDGRELYQKERENKIESE